MSFKKKILHFKSVTSTFDKLAQYEPQSGLTVVADRQTSGVGRNSREWVSDDGGAYFSFYIQPDCDMAEVSFLTIVCALAAQNTLKKYVDCGIKWPNDIVYDGKKLCGILNKSAFCGNNSLYVMAGIGINVNNTRFGALDYRATSLRNITGKSFDRNTIVEEFLDEFEKVYSADKNDIILEYSKSCVTLGSRVAVHYNTDDAVIEGECVSICKDGSIDIETDGGIVNVNAGEVSVRGIYGYV